MNEQEVRAEVDGEKVPGGKSGQLWLAIYTPGINKGPNRPYENEVRYELLPRWEVLRGDELLGSAAQLGGDGVLNTEQPSKATEFVWRALAPEFSSAFGFELRDESSGVRAVWSVREPYVRGQGYEKVDTGIRIIDAWETRRQE